MKNLRRNPSYSTMASCLRKMQGLPLGSPKRPKTCGESSVHVVHMSSDDENDPILGGLRQPIILEIGREPSESVPKDAKGDVHDHHSYPIKPRNYPAPIADPDPASATEGAPGKARRRTATKKLVKFPVNTRTSQPQPSSASSDLRSTTPSFVFLTTGLNEDEREISKSSYNKIGPIKAKLRKEYSNEVTHIISGCNQEGLCLRTVKYLRGLLDGKLIVTYDWFLASLSANEFVPEDPYLIQGDEVMGRACSIVAKSIAARRRGDPPLFSGVSFYLTGVFRPPSTPSKKDLADLIAAGGGTLLSRRPGAANADAGRRGHVVFITENAAHAESECEGGTAKCSWNRLFDAISTLDRGNLFKI